MSSARHFSQAVLRFTDSTYDDIKKGGSAASGGCDAGLLKDSQNTTRHKLKDNLEARILQDVLSPEPGGLFVAFIHGKHYNDKELYEIDPDWGSDQVNFRTYDENKWGHWASSIFPESTARQLGRCLRIEHQQLDVTFEKSGSPLREGLDRHCGAPQRRPGCGLRPVPALAGAERDRKRAAPLLYSGGQERRRRLRRHFAQSSQRRREGNGHDELWRERGRRPTRAAETIFPSLVKTGIPMIRAHVWRVCAV